MLEADAETFAQYEHDPPCLPGIGIGFRVKGSSVVGSGLKIGA